MENKKLQSRIILGLALVLIVGTIWYLESTKVSPISDTVNQDIDVAAIIDDQDTSEATEVAGTDEEGSVESTESPTQATLPLSTEERLAFKQAQFEPAKEISTPDGFINVEDINITELIGEKIILVDFWTYSCINCQRTLPFLNDWHEKYEDDGLVILGIHTPEFKFEEEYDNVARAVEKWGVEYPVILDNDYSTWRSYQNRYWPRKYLIDIDGFIVYDHIGEGAYDETEAKIVELLNEKNQIVGGSSVSVDGSLPENIDEVDFRQVGSPETYLGSGRVELIANMPSLDCLELTCEYVARDTVNLNRYQLDGRWRTTHEHIVLESATGSIFYRFKANKANLVAGNMDGVEAEIYLNGELISDDVAGQHVENGKVLFTDSDLYNLVDLGGSYEEHLLEIRFIEPGVEAFAFTFG